MASLLAPAVGHTVSVQGLEQAVEQLPVSAPVPQELAGKSIVLADADGNLIATQMDPKAESPRIVFIVPKLGAGEKRTWTMKEKPASEKVGEETAGLQLVETEKGMEVRIDGELFTTYLINAGPKPYFWPVHGPHGNAITRAYPMDSSVEGEEKDHPHHRSFWFTHGDVNGIDFWAEGGNKGKTIHQRFEDVVSGPVFGEFTSVVDWVKPDGTKVAEDRRRYRFYRVRDQRLFDVDIRMTGSSGPLVLGDTKEGSFGFRIDRTMRADKRGGAMIINSEGHRNLAAWGKRAKWCDCYGPLDGQMVGIAIFDNPQSFRFPTYWHVRHYGLFCANPFGIHDFDRRSGEKGTHTVNEGEELHLIYRIYIHPGTAEEARVAEQYAAYEHPPKVSLD